MSSTMANLRPARHGHHCVEDRDTAIEPVPPQIAHSDDAEVASAPQLWNATSLTGGRPGSLLRTMPSQLTERSSLDSLRRVRLDDVVPDGVVAMHDRRDSNRVSQVAWHDVPSVLPTGPVHHHKVGR